MSLICEFWKDPHAFQYIIIFLYLCNALRLGWEGRWAEVLYWLSAMSITISVTWMNH